MISSCAGCNLVSTWASIFVGTGGGLIYLFLSRLLLKLQIDDPLDAFAVHAGGGFWGLISVCLFTEKGGLVYALFGSASLGQALLQLCWNFVGAMAIVVWSAAVMIPIFSVLKKIGKFRVPTEVEIKGIDIRKHGESAYPLAAYGHGWDETPSDSKSSVSLKSEDQPSCSNFTKDGWAVIRHDPVKYENAYTYVRY